MRDKGVERRQHCEAIWVADGQTVSGVRGVLQLPVGRSENVFEQEWRMCLALSKNGNDVTIKGKGLGSGTTSDVRTT